MNVMQANLGDVENAIVAMGRAFEEVRGWSAYARFEVCRKVYEGVAARAEDFARVIAEEARKPIRTARGEVARAMTTFRLAMEESTRMPGEVLAVDIDARSLGYRAVVERFAIGPCLFVTPFNFPLNLVAHKVAPALVVGCPFIVKPSERTPRTAMLLGEVLAGAGMPAGFWHVLACDRESVRRMVADERIKLLSFTGSPEVGWKLKAEAGKKAVVLELGGNAAVVVEPPYTDADLVDAVGRIVTGAFGYAGQSCISVQRIYLHEAIAEEAIAMLVEGTRKLIVGAVMDEKTDVGPMIDEAAAERIERWVESAVRSGGEALIGRERRGDVYLPTLLRNVPRTADIACNEAFGPVAMIETYVDFEEVLGRVNDSRFGLQAGIFTRDLGKGRRAFERLEVGGVIINDVPTMRVDNMPYGGVKDSGVGREGVKYAMEEMTVRKVMVVRGS